jgi:general secretion pathway protein M
MKQLFDRALTYWRTLSARERLILGGGATALLLVLLYSAAWAPLQQDLARLRVSVPKAHEQLQWMRSQENRVRQLRANAPATSQAGGLLSFVEQSAKSHGVQQSIKRTEPDGASAVRVALDGVAFNSLVGWLAHLQKQGGLRIDNASLEPLPTPGMVNARLVLRSGSP